MQVAAVTQPDPGVDLGAAFTSTIMFTVSNVPRADYNGGRAQPSLMEQPSVKIINPGGHELEDIVLSVLMKRRASRVGSNAIPLPVNVDDDNILLFSNHAHLEAHNNIEKSGCKKAGLKSAQEKEQTLTDLMISYD